MQFLKVLLPLSLYLLNSKVIADFDCSDKLLAEKNSMSMAKSLVEVSFEVFGTVQGVFFRKFTQSKAQELGLTGWVRNNRSSGSVQGILQGPSDAVNTMKVWLRTTGSPQSHITRAEFGEDKLISSVSFNSFDVSKTQ